MLLLWFCVIDCYVEIVTYDRLSRQLLECAQVRGLFAHAEGLMNAISQSASPVQVKCEVAVGRSGVLRET
jgi:hypothetical protein